MNGSLSGSKSQSDAGRVKIAGFRRITFIVILVPIIFVIANRLYCDGAISIARGKLMRVINFAIGLATFVLIGSTAEAQVNSKTKALDPWAFPVRQTRQLVDGKTLDAACNGPSSANSDLFCQAYIAGAVDVAVSIDAMDNRPGPHICLPENITTSAIS